MLPASEGRLKGKMGKASGGTKVLTRRVRDSREDAICMIRDSKGREASGTLVELAGYTAILTSEASSPLLLPSGSWS